MISKFVIKPVVFTHNTFILNRIILINYKVQKCQTVLKKATVLRVKTSVYDVARDII